LSRVSGRGATINLIQIKGLATNWRGVHAVWQAHVLRRINCCAGNVGEVASGLAHLLGGRHCRTPDMDKSDDMQAPGTRLRLEAERSLLVDPQRDEHYFVVLDGLVVIETASIDERRRIADFLFPGDAISSGALRGLPVIRLRGIEPSTLVRHTLSGWLSGVPIRERVITLEAMAARAHFAGLLTRLQDIDARVASFLLLLATRKGMAAKQGTELDLVVTREDVAAYIAVNPDTLSRSYSRLKALGLIGSPPRHRIPSTALARLAAMTPLAAMIR